MKRVFNFNPGPATLPLQVLETAQKEFIDYKNTGMSIMEHSHRGKDFEAVVNEADTLFHELWNIPSNFKVLFLQGGASSQFFMVPMNLAGDKTVDYISTGVWSEKAIKEAQILGKKVNIVADTKDTNHNKIPKQGDLKLTPDAAYVHITTNNTIFGTQWHYTPDTKGVPIIADMSSDALSYPLDFSKFGMVYAGAQKNLGPSGVAVVIIREDLMEREPKTIPTMLKYSTHAKENSLYNTPPSFSIYMINLILKWVKSEGGLIKMEERNQKKAGMVYDAMDNSNGFYKGHAEKDARSLMNVTFVLAKKELDDVFAKEAAAAGLVGLKGHRSVGGMRASIYNAMPVEGCEKLAQFMNDFAKKNK
ncbi:MAG: phosphoserine transaminase [Spirochaetes bacterium GWB1_36_13]|nr:MAG: phosphoserine transaminase [Spirochaetes bacterium GWB1_36_13]